MGSTESFRPWPRRKQLGQSPHFDVRVIATAREEPSVTVYDFLSFSIFSFQLTR